MISIDFEIKNSEGLKLACTIDKPDDKLINQYSLFSHCFTCTKELKAILNIHEALTKKGFGCLRFDYSGIGKSEGNFSDTNFTVYLRDLDCVINFMIAERMKPSLLIGHSFGGNVVLQSAADYDVIKALVIIGTPAEPGSLAKKLNDVNEETEREGISEKNIGGVEYKFTKQFFEDLLSYKVMEKIGDMKKPLLIMHSPVDKYTPIENASKIFQAANHPKNYISLDNIDHLILDKNDAIWIGNLIASWASRYL